MGVLVFSRDLLRLFFISFYGSAKHYTESLAPCCGVGGRVTGADEY